MSLLAAAEEESETPDDDTYTISSLPTANYQSATELKIKAAEQLRGHSYFHKASILSAAELPLPG